MLARTNAELVPYAAVAPEAGIPYRAAEDGLLLDEPKLDELLAQLPDGVRPAIPLGARGTSVLARALLAWSQPYPTADTLRSAVAAARRRRTDLRRDDARLVLATAHARRASSSTTSR